MKLALARLVALVVTLVGVLVSSVVARAAVPTKLVLYELPSVHPSAWPDGERRLEAELRQTGVEVHVHAGDPRPEPLDPASGWLQTAVVDESAIAGLALVRTGEGAEACLALADRVVECRPLGDVGPADAALYAVEWIHETLVVRGLWSVASATVEPSATLDPRTSALVDPAPPSPPPPASPPPTWSFVLGAGARAALDAPGPVPIGVLRLDVAATPWLVIGLDLAGTLTSIDVADARGAATLGFGAAHVRAVLDLVDDAMWRVGPALIAGALIAGGSGDAASGYVGHDALFVGFDGGAALEVGMGVDAFFASLEIGGTWTAPSLDVIFDGDRVATFGGPALVVSLGLGLRT